MREDSVILGPWVLPLRLKDAENARTHEGEARDKHHLLKLYLLRRSVHPLGSVKKESL